MFSPISPYSTCGFIIFKCDYGIVLIKEPTVERKTSPEAPKPIVAPVEQKILPPSKGIQSHIVVELFSGLFVSLWYVFACFVRLIFFCAHLYTFFVQANNVLVPLFICYSCL